MVKFGISIKVMTDKLFSSSYYVVNFFDIIIRPISFAVIAVFSFVFVIPNTQLPVSKCCNCVNGQLNCFLHTASTAHLILLSGLCYTNVKCCSSILLFLKICLHFLPSFCCFCFFFFSFLFSFLLLFFLILYIVL